MTEVASDLYSRKLTNTAGGNISCRVADRIYITPRGLGSQHRWQLREDMIVVLDSGLNVVQGDGAQISREARVHFECYQRFAQIGAVIHAHPRFLSVFAAAERPLPPTLEYTRKFGVVPVVPALPAHTSELAEAVVTELVPHQELLSRHGLGLILAGHGAVAVGRDLADAFDTLERLECSAQIYLMSKLLPSQD